ncbi:hypothetical protein J3R82DRAFT_197 [Butyriboletus roseoflavus]|nr:hypothetical protein J3R82DRAFT_197 [Butyriboletus roseoflavus]
MPPNFFSKFVKNTPPSQTPSINGRFSSDEQGVASPPTPMPAHPHFQTMSHPPSPRLSPYEDAASSNSSGSVKIGVTPPSPRTTESDLSVYASGYKPSIEQVHQASLQHRRVRSQERERHIPDRHEVSLAARPTSDITSDETELTPTPGRPNQAPDWVSSHSAGSSSGSPRQLSPASSTGNLKGFFDKQTARSHSQQAHVRKKPSNRSMRGTTQPPPPLNTDQSTTDRHSVIDVQHQAGRHEDPLVPVPNTVVDSPASFASRKAQSQELLGAKSPRRRQSGRRYTASGTPMSDAPLVPPVPPLPTPVSGSRSTLSVNGTKSRGGSSHSIQTHPHPAASKRSPALTRSPNISLSRSDFSDGDTFTSSGDESGSSSDELDLNEQDIPVTGFAVASSKRNADFHELFPNIPEGDYLIEDYGCALQREILIQGRLYISENHICFHANIFGWITDLSIPIYEITGLEKKMTAFVIPNAIQITTRQAKYTFASFLSRDTTYDVILNIWRLARPDAPPEDTLELIDSRNASLRDLTSIATSISISEGCGKEGVVPGANKVTHCTCSKNGGHLNELALETVLPGTPDKIYNLMFASGFIKDFMKVDQKLNDVQISDWAPIGQASKLLQRNMSYIKPLNNSVGPRQTKCEIHDEAVHCDFEDHVVMLTSTKTPDVPSGGVFVVKTRTCLMWASSITTRVIVSTQVEWTGRSFIKGLIEKSAIEGQKVYHSDLDKAMRMYIQEHQAEFIPEGLDPTVVAPVEPITPLAEVIGGTALSISAQEARKARERDRNRRGMQWAYDTFDGAYNVAARSTKGALELVKEAWEQSSSTTILWFVIVLLVFSNVWTLALVGNREEGVIAGIWEELAVERARAGGGFSVPMASAPVGDVQAEVANIGKVLDAVEQRQKAMARKGWYEALANALKKEQKEDSAVMQLATVDPSSGTPRVRSVLQRTFITASTLPTLPLILSTTDVRMPKVTELSCERIVEVVYWVPSTVEQFRISGRASIVPDPNYRRAYPARDGFVYEELEKEGFDWEAKRVEMFDRMSGHMKATWCRPVPGTPLKGGEEEMKKWPVKLPKLGEAENEEDEKNLMRALSNFALLLIEPFEVDYLELGVSPNRRTFFKRDESSVEFEETLVVP